MELLKNKKIIILMIVIILIIIGILIFFYQKRSKIEDPSSFAENFTKEFETYSYQNPDDYTEKLKPYLAKEYQEEFEEKFSLPPKSMINQNEINNYSKAAEVKINSKEINEKKKVATLTLSVVSEKVDTPGRPTKFNINRSITLYLVYSKNKWLVRNINFSTEQ